MPYTDPAAKLEADRAYRAARRAELAAKQRDYYRRHRSACAASNAAWLAAHPELNRSLLLLRRPSGDVGPRHPGVSWWPEPDLQPRAVRWLLMRLHRMQQGTAEFRQGRSFPRRLLVAA